MFDQLDAYRIIRNSMENKQNVNIQSILQRPISLSLKLNSKISNINNQIELEKEYLSKLKTQRQKTEKLHGQYLKLKAELDRYKDTAKKDQNLLNQRIQKCEEEIIKKTEESQNWQREAKKNKGDVAQIMKEKEESLEKATLAYENAIQELKHNIQNLNESLENKNKTTAALKKNHQNKIKEIEGERDKYLEEAREWEDRYKQSEQRFKEYDRQTQNLKKNNEQILYNLTRTQSEYDTKNRQVSTLKLANNKLQLQNQTLTRKISDLQEHFRYLQEQLNSAEKNNYRLQEKYEKCKEELGQSQRIKQKSDKQYQKICEEMQKMKNQLFSKDESIRQYQGKLMRIGESEEWKIKYQQLEAKNNELETSMKMLQDENDSLMGFMKQKQQLQRQRRALMENQMDQIHKFELLLKDVR